MRPENTLRPSPLSPRAGAGEPGGRADARRLLAQRKGDPQRADRMTPDQEVQHLPDRSLAATSADGSCSCVPPLVKQADRLTDLRTMIGGEVEPVVSLTHLQIGRASWRENVCTYR